MSFPSLLIHEATVPRFTDGDDDGHGNATKVPAGEDTYPCRMEQATTAEDMADRDTRVTGFRVFFGPEADLEATDHFFINETGVARHDIVGRPKPEYDAIGLHHYEVRTQVVEG